MAFRTYNEVCHYIQDNPEVTPEEIAKHIPLGLRDVDVLLDGIGLGLGARQGGLGLGLLGLDLLELGLQLGLGGGGRRGGLGMGMQG